VNRKHLSFVIGVLLGFVTFSTVVYAAGVRGCVRLHHNQVFWVCAPH
jgi:hypothetical protein